MAFSGLLYFFDDHVKPHILKGTHLLNPANTGRYGGGISAIREGDVNLWLYEKDGKTLAVDTGHINWEGIKDKFSLIGVDPGSVKHVLLTHADVDHAGGIDAKARWNIYPNAEVYLGKEEERYLRREIHRMVKVGKKIYNCVSLRDGYHLLEDGDELLLDGFKVKCFLIPGHTMGHMCYVVDDTILFSGDSIAINEEGGWAFWDFFCQDPEMNKESLKKLETEIKEIPIKYVCTGHSGISEDIEHLFSHTTESAAFGRKVVFAMDAPDDVCSHD